jgi:RimJ/RimL family protein N-acetyltransferase
METFMKTIVEHSETGIESTAPWSPPCVRERWCDRVPVLENDRVLLRELDSTDVSGLASLVASEEVSRFLSTPPGSPEAFDRSIQYAHEQRSAGAAVWYAVFVRGFDTPAGMFQVRAIEPGFAVGEWGFLLATSYWGTGVFEECAALVLEFAFGTLGVRRLEARVAVRNGRAIGALRKLGAVQEGLLPNGLLRNGEYLDQALYTISDDSWRAVQAQTSVSYGELPVH